MAYVLLTAVGLGFGLWTRRELRNADRRVAYWQEAYFKSIMGNLRAVG